MNYKLIPFTAVALLVLGGCQDQPAGTASDARETRTQAAQDVDAARRDANKEIARADENLGEARQDYAETTRSAGTRLTSAQATAQVKTADAGYDLAMVEARSRQDIARQKCESMGGAAKDACLSAADAQFAVDESAALAERDAVRAQAAYVD